MGLWPCAWPVPGDVLRIKTDMIPFGGITGQSYVLASTKAETELSINVYRERIESGEGMGEFCLNKSPGLNANGSIGLIAQAPVRGLLELNDHLFAAVGALIGDYTSSYVVATYGAIANDGLPVQMAASPTSLVFVSAGVLYRINGGALTTPALPFTPAGVVYGKNYFIALSRYSGVAGSGQQFFWSSDDGATWPAGNVQTAEAKANNMVAIQFINQMLCLIGNRITQWFSVGSNPNAPFVPIDSGVIQSGTEAASSIAKLGQSLLWLEQSEEGQHSVIMTNGFTPNKISNNYVANKITELAAASRVDDAIGMTYSLKNQDFYRLTFPTADYTLEYNKTLNEWQCPLWWDWRNGQYRRHRANCITSAFGRIYAGDHTDGNIFILDPTCYHDRGFPIRWNRRSPHVAEANKHLSVDRLELWMQTGVGLVTPLWLNDYTLDAATFAADLATQLVAGNITVQQSLVMQLIYDVKPYSTAVALPDAAIMTPLGFYEWGRDPRITMQYSPNGGKGWSNELNRALGRAGEDRTVYWNRLGAPRDFVVDLFGDDPCQVAISGAWLDAAELLS